MQLAMKAAAVAAPIVPRNVRRESSSITSRTFANLCLLRRVADVSGATGLGQPRSQTRAYSTWVCELHKLVNLTALRAVRYPGYSLQPNGNGGIASGFTAMDMSRTWLSSAAILFELNAPQSWQRWMIAHSPFLRTHTPMASMIPLQSDARSPGLMSRWTLERQAEQWLRWRLPAFSDVIDFPQTLHIKTSS